MYVAVLRWMKASMSRILHSRLSYFLIFYMWLSDLVPFYSEYSSYGSVMEGCEFAEVVLCEIPGLAAPEESVERACYVYLRFNSFVDVLVVKEVFCSSHE